MKTIGFFEAVKEYNKYKDGHRTSFGVIVNIILIMLLIFTGLCFAFSRIVHNDAFGILMSAVLTFFIATETVTRMKERLIKKIPDQKKKYYDSLKLKRLLELSNDEFIQLALRSIIKKYPDMNIIKDGIFYRSGGIYIVFLMLPGKKEISHEKVGMALCTGAKNVIVICKEESAKDLHDEFGDKIADIVTDADIINDSPEFDYEEIKKKKKISFDKICNNKVASKFIKIAVMSLILAAISGMKAYFMGIAFLCAALGIIVYFMSRRLKARQ